MSDALGHTIEKQTMVVAFVRPSEHNFSRPELPLGKMKNIAMKVRM